MYQIQPIKQFYNRDFVSLAMSGLSTNSVNYCLHIFILRVDSRYNYLKTLDFCCVNKSFGLKDKPSTKVDTFQ